MERWHLKSTRCSSEDLKLDPSCPHDNSQQSLSPHSGIQHPHLISAGTRHTNIHSGKAYTHTHTQNNNNDSKIKNLFLFFNKKFKSIIQVCSASFIPVLGGQRQKDLCEFKSSRLPIALATRQDSAS